MSTTPPTPIALAIAGAAGRMGRRLVALAAENPALRLVSAFERPGHEALGSDSGTLAGLPANGVLIAEAMTHKPEVLIDFTSPGATLNNIRICAEQRIALVIGTTGLGPTEHAAIDRAAKAIPIVQAPNMSLGVNLLFSLAAQVAKRLGDDYDIEIVEAHHRFKKDAPSGTALGIAQAICSATGKDLDKTLVHGRSGDNTTRQRGTIGMHAVRMGDVVGEHSVFFNTLGERIELRHVASSRDTFVGGALRAATWLVGRPAGRYSMADVLGL